MFYTIMQILAYLLAVYFVIGMINPMWVFPVHYFGWNKYTRADVIHATIIGIAAIFCIVGIGTVLNIIEAKNEINNRSAENAAIASRSTAKTELMSNLTLLVQEELAAAHNPKCGEHVANDVLSLKILNSDINKLPDDFGDVVAKASYDAMINDMRLKLSQAEGCK